MIRAITIAIAGLNAAAAHAMPLEVYEFTGTIETSEMTGISVGSTFGGTLVLDLRHLDLMAPTSSNSSSSVWTNERGCSKFINGGCSHAPVDQLLFAGISASVANNPIPFQSLAYGRSTLGQYTAASQTGYQVTSYASSSVVVGDQTIIFEYHMLQLTLTSLLALFDDHHIADQPDLTVPLSSAVLTYSSSIGGSSSGGCSPSNLFGLECDLSSVNSFFRGNITSLHLLGDRNEIPEPSGLALVSLALLGAGVVRRTRTH